MLQNEHVHNSDVQIRERLNQMTLLSVSTCNRHLTWPAQLQGNETASLMRIVKCFLEVRRF